MSQPSADLQERARTMRAVGSEGWLPSDDDHAIAAFRQVLCEAGYSGEAIRGTLGIAAEVSFNRSDLPIYVRRLPEEGRPSTPIKLFLLGAEVDDTEVARSLDPAQLEIVERSDSSSAAAPASRQRSASSPITDCFYATTGTKTSKLGCQPRDWRQCHLSDPVEPQRATAGEVGVGPRLRLRRSGAAGSPTLCSCGVDINPRAIRVATFNAHLNDIPNAECRQGDMFERLPEETFDLVVSNPPSRSELPILRQRSGREMMRKPDLGFRGDVRR